MEVEKSISKPNMRLTTRYCFVENCIHFRGCNDAKVSFFMLPKSMELRNKYELAIKGVVTGKMCFGRICDRHFKSEDIKCKNSSPRLKHGVVPCLYLPNHDK